MNRTDMLSKQQAVFGAKMRAELADNRQAEIDQHRGGITMMSYDEMANECFQLRALNAELLVALKAVVHKFTDVPATKNYPELWQQCRAVIARAEQVTP